MAPMSIPRNYHSVAILLADGIVFSAGGGLCGVGCTANHYDAQIFRPAYLFNSDQTVTTRPKIISTNPANIAPLGSAITVTTDSAVTKFSMVRFGTATHSMNTDQSRVPLTNRATGSNVYKVQVPNEPGIAIPGWWMLFAINAQGVPSVAATINVQ
ncbi:MAG: hypothetical protein Q9178_004552 [Gyalolechia marmorata]